MPDILQFLLFFISVALVVIANRKAMASSFTTVLLVSLVMGIMLLGSRNRSLKSMMALERNATLHSLKDKDVILDNCNKESAKLREEIQKITSLKNSLSIEKEGLVDELANLKDVANKNEEMSAALENFRANSDIVKQENEKLKTDLNEAKQKETNLENEKTELQGALRSLQEQLKDSEDARKAADLEFKEIEAAKVDAAAAGEDKANLEVKKEVQPKI